jgi:hypothetical protein
MFSSKQRGTFVRAIKSVLRYATVRKRHCGDFTVRLLTETCGLGFEHNKVNVLNLFFYWIKFSLVFYTVLHSIDLYSS